MLGSSTEGPLTSPQRGLRSFFLSNTGVLDCVMCLCAVVDHGGAGG